MTNDKKRWKEPKVSSIDDLATAFGATCSPTGGSASGCATGGKFSNNPQECRTGGNANSKCAVGPTAARNCANGSNI